MAIQVIHPGLYSTLQDTGRYGWQAYGVSPSGAMDLHAATLANLLLHNRETDAVIEMTLRGMTIIFTEPTILAIVGAEMKPLLNEKKVKQNKPIVIKSGDILSFGNATKGMRTYLAVKGGFNTPSVLGSKSTDRKARLGGFCGRELRENDRLSYQAFDTQTPFSWSLSPRYAHYLDHLHKPIRFIAGKHYGWFTSYSQRQFTNTLYSISPQSDRMGYRLTGPPLERKVKRELITEGTNFGSIQIPPSGAPIILMAERQPTGGYPRIGEVISVDLPRLSQMRPGQSVKFQEISLLEAQQLELQQQREYIQLKAGCKIRWEEIC